MLFWLVAAYAQGGNTTKTKTKIQNNNRNTT